MPQFSMHGDDAAGARLSRQDQLPLDEVKARVARTAQETIITRLLLRFGVGASPRGEPPGGGRTRCGPAQVKHLARLVAEPDYQPAAAFVDELVTDGASPDAVFLELLSGAARHLEAAWRDDRCTSTDMTIGMCNLRLLVCRLLARVAVPTSPGPQGGHAAIVAMPGDRASFDPILHQVYLWQAGWTVDNCEGESVEAVVDHFRHTSIDMAVVSIVEASQLDRLADCLRAIRAASRNRGFRILLLSAAFDRPVDLLLQLDADGIVHDPLETLWQAEWCRPGLHRLRRGSPAPADDLVYT